MNTSSFLLLFVFVGASFAKFFYVEYFGADTTCTQKLFINVGWIGEDGSCAAIGKRSISTSCKDQKFVIIVDDFSTTCKSGIKQEMKADSTCQLLDLSIGFYKATCYEEKSELPDQDESYYGTATYLNTDCSSAPAGLFGSASGVCSDYQEAICSTNRLETYDNSQCNGSPSNVTTITRNCDAGYQTGCFSIKEDLTASASGLAASIFAIVFALAF